MRAGLSTLLVSNLTPAELKQNVGDSIWRRLIETGGDPIEADWPRVQQYLAERSAAKAKAAGRA